jgi:hypothetical protein
MHSRSAHIRGLLNMQVNKPTIPNMFPFFPTIIPLGKAKTTVMERHELD